MTTTIQRLDQTATTLNVVIQSCSNATSKSKLMSALSSANRSLSSDIAFLKDREKRKYIQARTALQSVCNMIDGIVQGLIDGDISKTAVRTAAKVLETKFVPAFAQGLLAQAEEEANSRQTSESGVKKTHSVPKVVRERIKISISGSAEMRDAYKVVVEAGRTVGEEVTSSGPMSELEAMSQQARALLPVKIPGEFKIVRVPIVPVFSNFNAYKPEGLIRAGFKPVSIEGFVILKDQLLLLVSRTRANASGVKPLDLAYSVVDMLNDRGTHKYEIVSDVANVNPRSADLLMYWILPASKMSGLMKLLGTGGASKLQWGLPLPSATADADQAKVNRREAELAKKEVARQEALDKLAAERAAKERARRLAQEKAKLEKSGAESLRAAEKKERASKTAAPKSVKKPVAQAQRNAPSAPSKPVSMDKLRILVDKHRK